MCCLSASRLTATLINKYIDGMFINSYKIKFYKNYFFIISFVGDEYNFLIDELKLNLENYLNLSSLNINNVIIQISWITKSLSIKGHGKMLQWIDWVIIKNNNYYLTD